MTFTGKVEILVDGAWVDITQHVYMADGVSIRRGRSAEASQVDASNCSLTLNNRDGRYSPRNPASPYYGKLGRNTPIRYRFTDVTGGGFLYLNQGDQHAGTTAAGPNITNDIDVRVDLEPTVDWTATDGGSGRVLAGKWNAAGNQRSWYLKLVTISGFTFFQWSHSTGGGSSSDWLGSKPVPFSANERAAIRVTHDVDNGAGQNVITIYTAPTIDGPWTQFDQRTSGGTVSIFDSTAQLWAGDVFGREFAAEEGFEGKIYALQVRDGIDGTVVVNTDFTTQIGGDTSFTDATSLAWSLSSEAYLFGPGVRFSGEVSSWPQRWDLSGNDIRTPLEASGLIRRLSQGASPLRSAIFREIATESADSASGGTAELDAYWPLEDGENATTAAAGIPGNPVLSGVGRPTFTTSEHPVGSTGSASFTGAQALKGIVLGSSPGEWTVELWFRGEPGATGAFNVKWFTPGGNTARTFNLAFNLTADTIVLSWADAAGTSATILTGPVTNLDDGTWRHILVTATTTVGSDFELFENGVSRATGSAAASVLGAKIQTIQIGNGTTGTSTLAQVCHFAIWDDVLDSQVHETAAAGYVGERAGARIHRLCAEEDITLVSFGDLTASAKLGPQAADTLLNLLQEAAEADLGILYEPREVFGLAYRTKDSLYNQAAVLPLTYADSGIASLEPVDDDQQARNDITTSRKEGSSYRVELAVGALSVQEPPNGIGRYDDSPTINVQNDDDLPDQAWWRLHLGTVDEPRFPNIELSMKNAAISANAERKLAAHRLNIGDRLAVTDVPAWLPPEDISQLAQGFNETVTEADHRIIVNCSPETPYGVGVWRGTPAATESADDRWDTAGSQLYTAVDADDTQLEVITTTGEPWVTGQATAALLLTAEADSFAETPDHASLDITGDLDIRVKVAMDDWAPSNYQSFVGKAGVSSQNSYLFWMNSGANLEFLWSANGSTTLTATATAQVPFDNGTTHWIRATIDVDNGAAGRTVTFYTSEDGSSWSTLGSSVVQAGVTSIFNSTTRLNVGQRGSDSGENLRGCVYYAEVRNGIGGTVVANPDFAAQAAGTTSFADSTGKTWTLGADASIGRDAGDLPFDIMLGGERMTVTAVTNPGDPIALVNVGAGYSNNNASGAPGLPALTAVDDAVLIFASIRNTAATVNTPTNWTKLTGFGGTHAAIFARVYDGVWTMPTITYSGGAAGDDTLGQSCAFRGIDITPDAVATQSNGVQQNIPTPSLDVTSKGTLIVWAGWKQDDWTDASHANGLAATINSRVGTAGNDAGQVWSYRIFDPAADIGASQFNITGGASATSRAATLGFRVTPQLFTVTRSVNGVAKAHSAQDPLSLFNKSYWVM